MRLTVTRAISGMAGDASAGAIYGALFGFSFGSFGIGPHGEAWRMLPIAGYWALCVAAVAILVGSLSRIFEAVESTDLPTSAGERVVVPPTHGDGIGRRNVLPRSNRPTGSIASA